VWLAVEDHGIGIDADELALIFEPFRRGRGAVERNLPGIGLGLSLVLLTPA
jgi:signal transduction histidine kinase